MNPMRPIQLSIVLVSMLLTASAWAAGVTFEWVPFSSTASGQPASNRTGTGSFGTLTTVDGKGGPGDSLTLADIAFFEFTHEWEDTVTGETGTNLFTLTDLVSQPLFPLIVSADGAGFDSGSIRADNGPNTLRLLANFPNATFGDVNDNYVVDEFAQTGFVTNGWNGGGFGGWVSTAVVPVPGAFWLFGSALGMLGWLRRS